MADSTKHTLCWDCSNATEKRCTWAAHFQPVEGWEANKTETSWFVVSCPQFRRDSYGFGLYRRQEDYLKLLENRRRKWK